jgi:hypothetical protein
MAGFEMGLRAKGELARCPGCNELIDSSVAACRFCGVKVDPADLRNAAMLQRSITEQRARANNRRALIGGIVGLIATAALWGLWFAAKAWLYSSKMSNGQFSR